MIQLGNEAIDSVTGFQGIVTSITKYLTGCDRIVLTPKAIDGEIKEGASFDINSCELVNDGVREKFFPKVNPIEAKMVGGPEIYSHKRAY